MKVMEVMKVMKVPDVHETGLYLVRYTVTAAHCVSGLHHLYHLHHLHHPA
jgi:hypothetical protein